MLQRKELKDLTGWDVDNYISAFLSQADILCEIRDYAKEHHKEHWAIKITRIFRDLGN